MKWRLKHAVDSVQRGEVIAYPTEAVYGLGCNPWNQRAVEKILAIKQRPWQKGVILIASDFTQLQEFVLPISETLMGQLSATWPGPVTWLLPAQPYVPEYLKGEHDTIAVRVTAHKQTAALCDALGHALVSTSANRAGKRPAKHAYQVSYHLPEVDYVLPGACVGSNKPSQIRHGITGAQLR
jgi:L-threonylcarbamoyladenylate synthase